MAIKQTVSFDVDIKGDVTGTQYPGVFKVKTKLSIKEKLKEDEIRRSILGVDSQNASPDAKAIAAAIAYLSIRVVDAPKWWLECGSGADLEDINVLADVNNLAMAEIAKEYEALSQEATKAQSVLKAELKKE
jgi:hypothetical protein